MLLDIAQHPTTPRQQRGEIILFLSLFDSGRAVIDRRQRQLEQLDAQGKSQDALVRIARVRASVENLAQLASGDVITEQPTAKAKALPKQQRSAHPSHTHNRQPHVPIN